MFVCLFGIRGAWDIFIREKLLVNEMKIVVIRLFGLMWGGVIVYYCYDVSYFEDWKMVWLNVVYVVENMYGIWLSLNFL